MSCSHNCSSCSENCSDRKEDKTSLLEKPHELSSVKKVIAVVSGKGGVGKSLITALSAVTASRNGYKTAVLDADITGPSIPKMFGISGKAQGTELGLMPKKSKFGTSIMSLNLLVDNETDPVVWRGPVIAGAVKQFWTDVIWSDIDFMFVDMPPGTGDVPLTVFQSLPIDGIIIVTSPQQLVSMIVEKAVNMAKLMNIPILGLVENMSYLPCPDCGKHIHIFGQSHALDVCSKYSIPLIAQLPLAPNLAKACDNGNIELFEGDYLNTLMPILDNLISSSNK